MIGILGLQGDYAAHGKMLDALNTPNRVVKKTEQLAEIDGLIFPGGESTTLIKLMDAWDWWQPLTDFAAKKPVFGTCAGMILVAKSVANPPKNPSTSSTSMSSAMATVVRSTASKAQGSFAPMARRGRCR